MASDQSELMKMSKGALVRALLTLEENQINDPRHIKIQCLGNQGTDRGRYRLLAGMLNFVLTAVTLGVVIWKL